MTIKIKDPQIRQVFLDFARRTIPSCCFIEELCVNNGISIADIVSLGHNSIHCYEIKSDVDNLKRALVQAVSYDQTFEKVTLITTKLHVSRAIEILPAHWGIIQVDISKHTTIKYIRKAQRSPLYSKSVALRILWKSELSLFYQQQLGYTPSSKLNRQRLIDAIHSQATKMEVIRYISTCVKRRINRP